MAKPFDVVVLTDHRYLEDSETDTYKHNVFLEDALLKEALDALGLHTQRLAWDDPTFDWSTTKAIVFRTTWDYFDRFEEFSKWLKHVRSVTTLINSAKTIYWNIDKHYLFDMQANGVSICETYAIEKGSSQSLSELMNMYRLKEAVLKPCISGAARHTYKINAENIARNEPIFKDLIAKEAMLLQPFQKNIVSKGEISMMVMDGQFTHAVLKIAKQGDFRVQDDFGGTVHPYTPTHAEIEFAEHAVKSCPEPPLYARVDVFLDNNNQLALAELELIEPELWFRFAPNAATVLAKGIQKRIANS